METQKSTEPRTKSCYVCGGTMLEINYVEHVDDISFPAQLFHCSTCGADHDLCDGKQMIAYDTAYAAAREARAAAGEAGEGKP